MDTNKVIDSLGAQPLLELISESFGGWTVGGSEESTGGAWNPNKWNFQSMLESIHSLGLSSFFSIWVGEDEKEPSKNILQVCFSLQYIIF